MDGLFVDNPSVIESMDRSLAEGDTSTVLVVKKGADGYSSGKSMTSEEFDSFRTTFQKAIHDLCDHLLSGSIDIEPRKISSSVTACTYCDYGSICLFDTAFQNCKYH